MDYLDLTIAKARELLTDKKISSVELTKFYLERIKKLDKNLNAFLTVSEKEAIDSAKIADEKIANGEKAALLGIPIALKDIYMTKGIRTTAGSKVLENYIAQYDSTAVTKLKQAGAVIVGKLNCDAWAHGSSGENSDYGPAKNPWDTTVVPGGSSSGSAVSVSAGFTLASGGTDTGGSIRLPASFCNIVGLKPTYGRVSRYGIIAMASSLDTIGHFTKTIEDNALYLGVTAGKDLRDATTVPEKVPNYLANIKKGVKGVKIGIPKEYFSKGLSEDIEKPIRKALKKYEELGAEIVEISLPYTSHAIACYYIIQPAEVSSNLARFDGIRYGNTRETFGAEAKRRIMLGTFTLSAGYYDAYYKKAMQVRTKVIEDYNNAWEKVDVIVAPVSPTLPWKLGEKADDPLAMYLSDVFTVTANIAGIPGLVVPVGFNKNPSAGSGQSLPVGMQILGPQFSEEKLYQVGYAYEKETEFWKEKPNL
ncbi:MAG: Asp-tRNA(Asn)/Glu-tRNA(Gln) amidotransferase subunit GatA [Patescibacteria group bacterium]|nr:Asp-tRNA(Asn)/Glu-tRNA(Gln) amidotransferase subunit GatA [Patescibacteria group bacterium]